MHRIGILSDTHGLLRQQTAQILASCDAILHAGDFGSLQIFSQLEAIAPLYAVRGNIDKEWAKNIPKTLRTELFGLKIFMAHNKKQIQDMDPTGMDIIIYGHSHKYALLEKNSQAWLNPGSCGPKRFSLPVTMAVLSTHGNGDYTIEKIDVTDTPSTDAQAPPIQDMKRIVLQVMAETDKGRPVAAIAKNCKISEALALQICRLYLTHPGVTPDGILGKMGL